MINHKAVQKIDKHQVSRYDGVINLHSVFLFNNYNEHLMCSKICHIKMLILSTHNIILSLIIEENK